MRRNSTLNDINMNVNKNNGYFSMNSEKLPNISDATFNENCLIDIIESGLQSVEPHIFNKAGGIPSGNVKIHEKCLQH